MDISSLKITTLCENTSKGIDILGEWGLSFFIETEKHRIIFDTGGGKTILHNTDTMGIRLEDIDLIALSHGHQDHTGGIKPLLKRIQGLNPGKKIEIYSHPEIFQPKFIKDKKENYYYRGFPFVKEELESWGAKYMTQKNNIQLSKDIFLSDEIPQKNNFEYISDNLFTKDEKDNYIPDSFTDEKTLYIKTDQGLVVISGCAHRGIINTIQHGQELTGCSDVFMVIGGTHLVGVSEEQFNETLNYLRTLKISKLGVSHCTGLKQASRLAQAFGEEIFFFSNAGTIIDFQTPDT